MLAVPSRQARDRSTNNSTAGTSSVLSMCTSKAPCVTAGNVASNNSATSLRIQSHPAGETRRQRHPKDPAEQSRQAHGELRWPADDDGSGKNWKYGRHVKVNGLVRQQTLGVADLVDLIVGNRLLHARQRQRQEQGHHRAECESGLPCLPFSRLGRNPRRHHHRLRPAH